MLLLSEVEAASWELQGPCCGPTAALAAPAPKPQLLLVACKTSPGERSRSYLKPGSRVSELGWAPCSHSPAWGNHKFPWTMFTGDKARADLVRSSMSNHVPYLDTIHSQLPGTRRSLSHHMLCHIAGTMGFCEDSSPFLAYQCDAGEQGLLLYPSRGPWALGGLCPAPGCLVGGQGSLCWSLKLLGRNGEAYKERGRISPLKFTGGLGHGCNSHIPHICFRVWVRLIQRKKIKYVDRFAVCKQALFFCEWVHSPSS